MIWFVNLFIKCNSNNLLTKVIAEFWGHVDMATTKSNSARNMFGQ